MKVELITIGDEILIGQIIDTNSAWMAQRLNEVGISVVQISSISDTETAIVSALDLASARADVILITGGLGPTNDDITKSTLASYFNTEMVLNQEVLKHVREMFKSFNAPMLLVNEKQAEVPAMCEVIMNPKGTAPGMWFEKDQKVYVSMPGVPYEMKEMMAKAIIPKLQEKFKTPNIIHKTILTQGLGESFLAEKIADWENSLSDENIKLAYLPSPGIVRLRLSTIGLEDKPLIENIDRKIKELHEILGVYIFGYEQDTLESIIGGLLSKEGKTISTAESCTGGYIAHLITTVPGSSNYFKGSVVAYANEIKENVLGIDAKIIEDNGAVSEEVVKAMAKGILNLYQTDYAISCSGIAGPDGGTEDKPVGTVWICVASKEVMIAKLFQFGPNRKRTIRITALTALNLLRKLLVS